MIHSINSGQENEKLKTFLALLFVLATIIIFFWPNLTWPAINITPSVGTNDFVDLNIPFRYFLLESLKKGEWPLWASKISVGYPLFAEGIGGFYPLYLLTIFLPLMISVNFTVIATYFLLGIFTFLLLQERKLSLLASVFGAINMALCGFAINQLMHWDILTSFVFFVGQLFFLEKLITTKRLVYLFAASLALGFQFLGGHPQMNLYSAIFVAVYFLTLHCFFGEKKILKSLALLGVLGALGIGIGMVQNLPMVEFTFNSTRASGLNPEAITRYNFSIRDLITFIVPFSRFDPSHTPEALIKNGWPADERYVYVGLLTLILAGWAIIRLWRRDLRVFVFTLILMISLLLSLGKEMFLSFILLLPPFNFFRVPLRFMMFVDFSLVVLGAYGFFEMEKWFKEKTDQGKAVILGSGLIIASFINIWFLGAKLHPVVSADRWYAQPEVAKFLKKNLQIGERVINEHYYYPTYRIFMNQERLWDDPQIFVNLRNLIPVFNNLLEDIDMTSGVANSAGLKISRYNDLELYLVFSGLKYPQPDKVEISDGYLFLNRLLGTRYILLTEEVKNPLLRLAYKTNFDNGQDQVYVYELTDYYPRAFLVPHAETLEPKKIKEHLLAGDFEPKQKIFLEENIDWGAKGGFAGTALIQEYRNQLVKIKTEVSGDGFLFLSDTYYPGWKVFVDGQPEKIYRANYAFRAVPLKEGKHEVIFRYQPDSFKYGLVITLISSGLIILGLVVTTLRKTTI